MINSLCLWIVCRQCYIMITVFVFHSTVGFMANVIVCVCKKIEKWIIYPVSNGHMPCTLAKPKHFWLMRNSRKFRCPMGLNVLRCGTDFGDKESFYPWNQHTPGLSATIEPSDISESQGGCKNSDSHVQLMTDDRVLICCSCIYRSCLIVLIIFVCAIVVFICVCSIARTGC